MAAATAGTLLSEISGMSKGNELLTNSAPSISAAALPFRGKDEWDELGTVSGGGGGTAASGIFCLLDRRTEELGWGPVARFFSALETFRFRDDDDGGGGAVGGEDSDEAAGARAAWLAAWRAEDLVILGDMRNLPTRLLARAQGADKEWVWFGGGEMRGGREELREEVEDEDAAPTAISQLRDDLAPG
ncbi:hypothetical protein Trihar35433_10997 [Trichoderma harzianum]|nr:hypothetical protein Trihar35433_10997 [Trichoderma harzianum]